VNVDHFTETMGFLEAHVNLQGLKATRIRGACPTNKDSWAISTLGEIPTGKRGCITSNSIIST
jgi:hypothetical protein